MCRWMAGRTAKLGVLRIVDLRRDLRVRHVHLSARPGLVGGPVRGVVLRILRYGVDLLLALRLGLLQNGLRPTILPALGARTGILATI